MLSQAGRGGMEDPDRILDQCLKLQQVMKQLKNYRSPLLQQDATGMYNVATKNACLQDCHFLLQRCNDGFGLVARSY